MVLITGGTGLVGAHLSLYLLIQGRAVRAIFRNEKSISKTEALFKKSGRSDLFQKIDWVKADVNDIPALEKAFQNISEVYHCAAFVSFTASDFEAMEKINIEGTANMVNLALAFNIKKFCYVSSIATLDEPNKETGYFDETSDWNSGKNHSDYAITKFGGETEVWRAAQEGLNVLIVNPGVIFGEGFHKQGAGQLISRIDKGFPFFTDGHTGVIYVKDVVHSMTALMEKGTFGQRYVLVSENIPFERLFKEIAMALHKKAPYLEVKKWMLNLAVPFDWLMTALLPNKKRSLTRDLIKASFSKDFYDTSKIRRELDFEFQATQTFISKIVSF